MKLHIQEKELALYRDTVKGYKKQIMNLTVSLLAAFETSEWHDNTTETVVQPVLSKHIEHLDELVEIIDAMPPVIDEILLATKDYLKLANSD